MAKMKFTSPSTDAQKAYFARSANMRFWAGLLVIVAPFIWAVADFVGLSGYIMPEHRVLSYGGTGLFLLFAHGLLIASALMVGYDMFDNNKVEGKVFAVLPILLTAGLLWFSWIGMEKIYLTQFAHKAQIVKTDSLDTQKTARLAESNEQAELNIKRIKEPFTLKKQAKKDLAAAEISKISRRIAYDDSDRRKIKRDIEAVKSRLTGELAAISEAESNEIAEVNKAVSSYSTAVASFHAKDLAAIENQNTYEREKELTDKQGANMKSFWFSICMAVLFWVSVLTRTRLDCKSGIIPTFEHTDGDKSDKVRETLFVINAILGSRYSRFLSRLHDNLAVEYETVTPKSKAIVLPPAPPAPPMPPTGGGGGGSTPPTHPMPPAPAQPLGGTSVLLKTPSQKSIDDAQMDLGIHADPKEVLALALAYDEPKRLRPTSSLDLVAIHEAGHGVVYFSLCTKRNNELIPFKIYAKENDGYFTHMNSQFNNTDSTAIKMAGFAAECIYLKHNRTDYFNEIMETQSNQLDIIESMAMADNDKDLLEYGFMTAYQIIQDNKGCHMEIVKALISKGSLDMIELQGFVNRYFPTPSVQVDKSEIKNPVPQPTVTVPQPKVEIKYSELDDKLERLRADILKNSESHFRRGDAKNNSVAKRIHEACDKAFLALKKGGEVSPSVLQRFKDAFIDRTSLCMLHEIHYDSHEDLMNLINSKEVQNG